MSVFSIAISNFKNNIKTYTMFFISMIVSVVILNNFFILINGQALTLLGEANAKYMNMIMKLISVVLIIFMLFFIWYTSNVFLRNRKKEIGLYTFMGVDLKTIGKIYFTEMMLIGLSACLLGIGIGTLFSKFFQMLVFTLAGFQVDVKFTITMPSIVGTFLIFMVIFLLMSIKGFINIARSKVIDLLNESKKTDRMPKINVVTYLVAMFSVGCIVYGYYLVIQSQMNAVKTLLLVCLGTYGLFYAVLPAIFKFLIRNKKILYKGENVITLNSLAYRIKKNYTTYATIGILTACTVTVLGTAVSMRNLYSMSEQNDQLYSISFSSIDPIDEKGIKEQITDVLGKEKFDLSTQACLVNRTLKSVESGENETYIVMPYQQFTAILKANGNARDLQKVRESMVENDQVIYVQRPGTLMSIIKNNTVTVADKAYQVSESGIRFKVLGTLLDHPIVVVNQKEYEQLKLNGKMHNFYGFKARSEKLLLEKEKIEQLGKKLQPYFLDNLKAQIGVHKTKGVEWLKLVYAIGAFLFFVFVLAEASIIYIKIHSDAMEDRGKYKILKNIGASKRDLGNAVRKEVALFYILPLSIGLLHSYFAILVLGKFLSENLGTTFFVSACASIMIFIVSAVISIKNFRNLVKI